MRKRVTIGLVAGALVLGIAPGVAADDRVGGCPPGGGWRLDPADGIMPGDVGNLSDPNQDGWVCVLVNPRKAPPVGSWIVIDNALPLSAAD